MPKTEWPIIGITLTVVIDFHQFLSQLSNNFHEKFYTHYLPWNFLSVSTSILEDRHLTCIVKK